MTAVLLAAGVVALSGVAVSLQRSAMPVALRVLPAALLFLTVPAASSGYWIMHAFREIDARGAGGEAAMSRLLGSVSGAMLLASLALAGTMAIAAMMRGAGVQSSRATTLGIADASSSPMPEPVSTLDGAPRFGAERRPPSDPTRAFQSRGVPRVFALMTPLAILPAMIVAILTADVGSMIVQAKHAVTGPNPSTQVAGMDLAEISRWVSVRLIVIVGAGAGGSIGLVLLSLVNMLPFRQAVGPGTVLYSRIAAALTGVAGIWLAMRFWGLLTSVR
jgi:uncharacterized membrane protein YuzA (DUF378 family)